MLKELSWARRMVMHPKEAQEFSLSLQAIQSIMTDPNETSEVKRETLSTMVNELSDKAFNLRVIAEQVMTIINMKQEVCKEYPSVDVQVDGIIEWLPRMAKYRDMLIDEVTKQRRKFSLQL